MKKIALLVAFFTAISLFAAAQSKNISAKPKKDTVRDLQNLRPIHVIKNREKRIALQKRQIKLHEKQLKQIRDMQAELDKETRDTH